MLQQVGKLAKEMATGRKHTTHKYFFHVYSVYRDSYNYPEGKKFLPYKKIISGFSAEVLESGMI